MSDSPNIPASSDALTGSPSDAELNLGVFSDPEGEKPEYALITPLVERVTNLPPDVEELLMLGAVDGDFYCRQWFPKAFRQESGDFHRKAWAALEGGHRYVGIEMFRGAGKTTLLRAFASKRIAYAESRTILYVSISQDHARRSVRWIRRQIQFNPQWAQFFGLSIGSKATDEWLEIQHGIDEVPISIIALGITGSTRGINLDDFRPDLIIVDDPCDEENTATPEQRKKISDLFFGALAKSLAPPVDFENALMCLLQTPLNEADLIHSCRKDPQWNHQRYSCFIEGEQSRWESRFPTPFLRAEKAAHAARNQLSLWLREMECKVIAEATASFRSSWLKPYPPGVGPLDLLAEGGRAFLWIDPVPPPSERQLQQGLKDKDYEVLAVVIKYRGGVYLAEYAAMRGHEPDWTVMEFWRLVDTYRVSEFGVELTAYQRTLKWLIDQSMKKRGRYIPFAFREKTDQRKKSYRIVDALKGITSSGNFYVIPEQHSEFIEQFTTYPAVNHDDIIEAVAEATRVAQESLTLDGIAQEVDGEDYEQNPAQLGACP